MSDRNQPDPYHAINVPDITSSAPSLDNEDTDSMLPSTHYTFMDGGDNGSSSDNPRHMIHQNPMDDVDLLSGYLGSDPVFFGREGTPNGTGFLPEDGDTMMEQDGRGEEEEEEEEEEGDDGDRLLEEGERERQSIQIYQKTHPDIQQQQQGGREIDEYEAIWKVSTFRPDWGVEKMRDNNPLTYWQSDCPNPRSPHTVDLYFHQATFIKQVSIFIDFLQDESYSPKEISIRGGTTYRDLHEITNFECDETVGWKNIDLSTIMNEPLRVFQLQIAVLSTHLNGRDVHIRQIKVYSIPLPYLKEKNETDGEFKTRTIFHKGLR